jgi:hypothetical protein
MSTPLSQFAVTVANLVSPSNGGYTAYTYETVGAHVDTEPAARLIGTATPTLYTDCSGWVNYALNTVAPIHQAVESAARFIGYFNPFPADPIIPTNESSWPWSRADVLSYFVGEMADGTNGFAKVADFAALQPGDLIAYALGIHTNPTKSSSAPPPSSGSALIPTQDTGHTMIVVGTPTAIPEAEWGGSALGLLPQVAHVYAIPVVDSSCIAHFDDTRLYNPVIADPPNLPPGIPKSSLQVGGLGFGTLWFATDAIGTPLQFRFDTSDSWYASDLNIAGGSNAAVLINAGRLTSTIDLSGSMLDSFGNLVVTAFADAAPMLNGAAYNAQSEILTGAGGLYVQGGGTIQLGADNSFTGGVDIAGAIVSLAGAGAAGRGHVEFVNGFDSTLVLENAAAGPHATLRGFSAGDAIILAFDPFTAGDHALWTLPGGAGGVLTIVNAVGTPIVQLDLNGIYSSSAFNVSSDEHGHTTVTTTVTSPVTAYNDAYVMLQGKMLTMAAASGVLMNDRGISVASLVDDVAHGVLQLAANGGFTYAPNAGFTGVDKFSYDANNDGTADAFVEIDVVAMRDGTTLDLLALRPGPLVLATYAAFLGRAPDDAGFTYWASQFFATQGKQSASTVLGNIANAFSLSSEAQALHPFLDHPQGATPAEIGAFVDSVYGNLFDRPAESAGLAYWTGQIQHTLASGGLVGSVVVNIMSGAQNSPAGQDVTTLMSRVAVGMEYVHEQQIHGAPWSAANDAADARALLHGVTSNPQSLLIGVAQAQDLVLGDFH